MGYLVITLYKASEKGDDRAYIIPNNVSSIKQVTEIVCDPYRNRTSFAVSLPKNVTLLRKKVVDRFYGGIEKLVEKVKLGKVRLSGGN